jgi:hypothetical protein
MQDGAPPPLAVRVDQFADRRFKARLAQRLDEVPALPFAVAREIPMLRLAPAAHAEVRTHRRDAFRARGLDAQKMAAIRMAGKPLDLHGFAGKRVRHEHRPIGGVGNAVAAVADAGDGEALGHGDLTFRRERPAEDSAAR